MAIHRNLQATSSSMPSPQNANKFLGKFMIEHTKLSAQCDCGQLSVNVATAPVAQLMCHCSDCRGATGLPCVEIAFFAPSGCEAQGKSQPLTMKGGSGIDKTYFSCSECGETLYATVGALNGAWAVIARRLSALKLDVNLHIWTSEKVSEIDIPVSATQSPKGVPEAVRKLFIASFFGKR